jgi:hypothetical protein
MIKYILMCNKNYERLYLASLFLIFLGHVLIYLFKSLDKYENCPLQVPYFVDHNTGFQSGDYRMILPYLFETYSSATL